MKKIVSLIIAAVMLASCVTVATAAKTGFSDVEEDRWSAAAIKYAVDNDYMKGVGGGKFDPEGSLTRSMVVTVLWRREKCPETVFTDVFKDVRAKDWFSSAVIWAKECGVVLGTSDTTFSPDDEITREQLVTMLSRYTDLKGLDAASSSSISGFPDSIKVSDWAKTPVGWAVNKGLIKGNKINGRDYIDPQGTA